MAKVWIAACLAISPENAQVRKVIHRANA